MRLWKQSKTELARHSFRMHVQTHRKLKCSFEIIQGGKKSIMEKKGFQGIVMELIGINELFYSWGFGRNRMRIATVFEIS